MPPEPKHQNFKSQADFEKARDEYILVDEEQGEQELKESPRQQIDRLAAFIMDEVPGEPSRSEGAVDTAIRWMREFFKHKEAE